MNRNFEEEFKKACEKGDTERVTQILQPKKKFWVFNTKSQINVNDYFQDKVRNYNYFQFLLFFKNFRRLLHLRLLVKKILWE